MNSYYSLAPVSSDPPSPSDARKSFSLLGLGIVELLERRLVAPGEAEFAFFNSHFIRFVKEQIHDGEAIEFLERGSQLADLYDALPKDVADEEFAKELAAMRRLCEQLWSRSLAA